jgi:hypothetical protein
MDETTKDVVPAEGGGQETPSLDTSPKDAEQGSPGGESQVEALSQQVIELTGMVRALQSDKDKGVARVSKEVKDLSEQLESYYERREAGLSHEQALREEVIDEIVAERRGLSDDTSVLPKEEPAVRPEATIDDYLLPLLNISGLKDNDPDVIEILRKERDPGKRVIAIGELTEKRKQAQETEPNPAAVLAAGGGEAVEGETLESVTKELNDLQMLPATPATRARIKELGKKHKELLPKG